MIAGGVVLGVVVTTTIGIMNGELGVTEPLHTVVIGFVAGLILGGVGGITGRVIRGIVAGSIVGAILIGISAMVHPAVGVADELRSFDTGSLKGEIAAAIYGMLIGAIGGGVGGASGRLVGPRKRTGSSVQTLRKGWLVIGSLVFLALGIAALVWLDHTHPAWWKELWTQGGQIEDIQNYTALTIDCKDPEIAVLVEGEGNIYSGGLANGLTMYLKPGTHTLRLKKGNQIVYEEKFSIAPGENHVVDLTGGVCQPLPAKAPFTSDEAKKHQAAWAKHIGVPVEIENSIGMRFRLIPPGEFSMGISVKEKEKVLQLLSEDWQKGLVREELSSQHMQIRSAFYLGETELTVGQFKHFTTATGYRTTAESDGLGGRAVVKGTIERRPEWTWKHPADAESDDHPVVQISLADAQAFCRWLSGVDGREYYIPNQQEWEFACRAGTETHWYCGNDLEQLDGIAWTLLNAGGKTHAVGQKAPNAFGLYDMLGNAEEVCVSDTGMPTARGGHTSLPLLCRSSSRVPVPLKETYYRRGVRIAQRLP
jgi:formylglycine-generating enzyme required for sulfatase activity